MGLTPRPIWPWALGFAALVVIPIVMLLVAPPDISFEVDTGGNGTLTVLLGAIAVGLSGLAGCAVTWQMRLALRARRTGRPAWRPLAATVATFLAPWLVGLVLIGATSAATKLAATGLLDVALVTALSAIFARRPTPNPAS